MKQYKVIYSGNSTRFKNFAEDVAANSEREAVERVYAKHLDRNYFPHELIYIVGFLDGSIIGVIDFDGKFNTNERLDFDSRKFFDSKEDARNFINRQSKKVRPGFEYSIEVENIIKDCDGFLIADTNDDVISYDGGCFSAEEI
jgi:hypothetical protein